MKAIGALFVCIQLVVLVSGQDPTEETTVETTVETTTETTTTPTTTTTTSPTTTTTSPTTTTTTPTTTTTTVATTTTKSAKTTKPPNCAKGDFGNAVKKCCATSLKDIAVVTNKKDKFCPQSPGALKVFNMFTFNKQQSLKSGLNNNVNFTDTKIIKGLANVARFANCYLTTNGAFNNVTNTFNLTALQTLLTANQDPTSPWVKILESAASTCVTKVNSMNPAQFVRKVKGKDEQVGGKPFFVAQCIAFAAIDVKYVLSLKL
ncbi:Hypothetical predicted protein [Cloeon dipterum]|uniref:Uncharacterized protein n=1 Tax=Cloeon dipterum TaxID=197152 RepID=A0A8S1E7K0_9INSE|nr:Hypothetical predicted protein [Cloeon dipterum]